MFSLLHLTSFIVVEVRIALSQCDWKDTVTVDKSNCGFFNTEQTTKHSDLRQVSPDRGLRLAVNL